jgi:thioester reductase-like protein
MPKIFFTGFPGFLGSELLPRVLERSPDDTAICLVQGKFLEMAQERVERLSQEHPRTRGRIELVEGDITRPGLGISDGGALQQETREIYHLAAVYDLSVKRDLAMRVNVDGTVHMLDFAEGCPNLRRFQYISTCYVSGSYAGIFSERDLIKGQEFNNFYEETKYHAEVEVQKRMRNGLPATVYRPAIVVGDSRTGATQKFDGPYYVIRWLLKQPYVAVMPMVGNPKITRVNVVPSDFLVDALSYLSGVEKSAGKVYQLADPAPLTVDEIIKEAARATGRLVVRVPLPKGVAKTAIDHVPGVYRLMGIPSSAIDYFVHPTYYCCEQTVTDLEGSGIYAPRFPDYIDALVRFLKAHPEIGSDAMV